MGKYFESVKKNLGYFESCGDGFYRGGMAAGTVIDDVSRAKEWCDIVSRDVSAEPDKRQEYIEELESIDADLRRLSALQFETWTQMENARRRILDIAVHFPTEYDAEKVRRSANWFFRNVSKRTDWGREVPEEECAEDGIAYLDSCLCRALGERQKFKIVDVLYEVDREGMGVSFTIPECLGVWVLSMPFASAYKPSVSTCRGRVNENQPYPLQMRMAYASPLLDDFFQTIISAWSFKDMAEKWSAIDMDAHRKRQYMPEIVRDGRVWKKTRDSRMGCEIEAETEYTEPQWMDMVREMHRRMLPEWSR